MVLDPITTFIKFKKTFKKTFIAPSFGEYYLKYPPLSSSMKGNTTTHIVATYHNPANSMSGKYYEVCGIRYVHKLVKGTWLDLIIILKPFKITNMIQL